ncbi:hypothetical protein GCK72_015880 [Caenorhabditis remanei]|uniref:Uncharacterized protein n=1 Tax=Caenorhabditis remanei TaxID=31234 RepID=A0A6A5GYE5_CAERE|nr:hypothetical protein GCK72_015880 [Caenorhabditis remanei]KAF1759413.1 hypothetical protein GCK72_015880 [Caenorhabditis remanei]
MSHYDFVDTDEYQLMNNMLKVDRGRIRQLEAKANEHQKVLTEQDARIKELETKDTKLEAKIDEQQQIISTLQANLEHVMKRLESLEIKPIEKNLAVQEINDLKKEAEPKDSEGKEAEPKGAELKDSETHKRENIPDVLELYKKYLKSLIEQGRKEAGLNNPKIGILEKSAELQDSEARVPSAEFQLLKIKSLTRKNTELNQENQKLTEELKNSQMELTLDNCQLADLKQGFGKKLNEMQNRYDDLINKVATLESMNLKETFDKKRAEIEVEEFSKELEAVNLKNEDLEAELAELKGKMAEKKEEEESLNLKNRGLEAELTDLKSKLAENKERQKKDQKIMEAELAELKGKLTKKKVSLKHVFEFRAVNQKNQDLEAELTDLKSKFAEIQEEQISVNLKNDKLEAELTDLKTKLVEKDEHIVKYQEFAKKTWIEGSVQKQKYNKLEAELAKRLEVEKRAEYQRMIEEARREGAENSEEDEEEEEEEDEEEEEEDSEDSEASEADEDSDESGKEDKKSSNSSWEKIFFGN